MALRKDSYTTLITEQLVHDHVYLGDGYTATLIADPQYYINPTFGWRSGYWLGNARVLITRTTASGGTEIIGNKALPWPASAMPPTTGYDPITRVGPHIFATGYGTVGVWMRTSAEDRGGSISYYDGRASAWFGSNRDLPINNYGAFQVTDYFYIVDREANLVHSSQSVAWAGLNSIYTVTENLYANNAGTIYSKFGQWPANLVSTRARSKNGVLLVFDPGAYVDVGLQGYSLRDTPEAKLALSIQGTSATTLSYNYILTNVPLLHQTRHESWPLTATKNAYVYYEVSAPTTLKFGTISIPTGQLTTTRTLTNRYFGGLTSSYTGDGVYFATVVHPEQYLTIGDTEIVYMDSTGDTTLLDAKGWVYASDALAVNSSNIYGFKDYLLRAEDGQTNQTDYWPYISGNKFQHIGYGFFVSASYYSRYYLKGILAIDKDGRKIGLGDLNPNTSPDVRLYTSQSSVYPYAEVSEADFGWFDESLGVGLTVNWSYQRNYSTQEVLNQRLFFNTIKANPQIAVLRNRQTAKTVPHNRQNALTGLRAKGRK